MVHCQFFNKEISRCSIIQHKASKMKFIIALVVLFAVAVSGNKNFFFIKSIKFSSFFQSSICITLIVGIFAESPPGSINFHPSFAQQFVKFLKKNSIVNACKFKREKKPLSAEKYSEIKLKPFKFF